MQSAPAVSCVIICYHRPEGLARMLEQLRHDRVEVVVVNAEVDPEVAALASEVVHVPLEGDPGYATGVNTGVRHVSSEYVVFMNDDLDITAETVLALRDHVAAGGADVAVPAMLDVDGVPEPTIRALPTPRTLAREFLVLPDRRLPLLAGRLRVEKWRQPAGPESIEACGAPVVAARTSLLRSLPMPEDYFLYWDEIEWFWWVHEAGLTVQYVPHLTAMHRGGRRQVSAMKSRLVTRNAVRCVRRTQGRRAAHLAFWVMLLYNLRLVVTAALRRALGTGEEHELDARLAGLRETPASWREIFRPVPAAPGGTPVQQAGYMKAAS